MSRGLSNGCARHPSCSLSRLTLGAVLALLCVLQPHAAAADPSGLATDAMPGLLRVPTALPGPFVGGAATLGYGHTGDALDLDDSHERLALDGAASVAPIPQLILGVTLGGNADFHRGQGSQGSQGFAAHGAVALRGRTGLGEHLHLALDARLWLPPAETAARSLQAVTPQVDAIVSGEQARWTWTGTLGVRFNRQGEAFSANTSLSPYEALALGLSDEPQVRVGAGAAVPLGPLTGLFEARYEAVVAGNRPNPRYAPLTLGLGVRMRPRPWLQLGGALEVALNPYPPPKRTLNAPIPPRVAVLGTAAFLWDRGRAPAPAPEATAPPAPVAAPAPAPVRGRVLGPDGRPLRDSAAVVHLTRGHLDEQTTAETEDGRFELAPSEAGEWHLRVDAEGYVPHTQRVAVPTTASLRVELERSLPPGRIEVRVQDFRGRRVDAQVTLDPANTAFEAGAEPGTYGLDLRPGQYVIEVAAEGYAPEKREAVVEENGVTILVVDLRQRPGAR